MATEKPVSAKELKTFIEAVEFAADAENWVPSERQWKRIRSMIDRLEENAPPAPAAPQPMRMPEPMMHVPQGPVMMAPGGLGGAMPMNQQPLQGPFATGSAQPVRTPDVDTSTGGYKSSFA
jgi:hypothetical protein